MNLETVYTLKQPLSHIGESEGTTTFLNTIRVLHNGKVEEVFAYTGNAIRGKLRDCAAEHLLSSLEIKVHKKEFNILFSGGNISGAMTTDVDQAARYRELLPIVSLFGAGIGNQILSGKITQGFALPACQETEDILPKFDGELLSWKSMTGSVSFTRMDDSKDVALQQYLDDDGTGEKKKDGEASTQMRYEVEYMVPGTRLYHVMNIADPSRLEVGCLVSAFRKFAEAPVLGGMGGKGFGLCDMELEGEPGWISIKDGCFGASSDLRAAEDEYNAFIKDHSFEIISLLGGAAM